MNDKLFRLDDTNKPSESEVIQKIKSDYNETKVLIDNLCKQQHELSKKLQEILKNETDVSRRKQIIDFVFENKVEEIHEFALRKMYLGEQV